jgi:apolipoprotein N-acyltransferase
MLGLVLLMYLVMLLDAQKHRGKMGIAHGASEQLWTRPFRAVVVSITTVMAPSTRVLCMLLGPCAIVTLAMLSVRLRFRLGTRSAWAVTGQKAYR